MSSAKSRSDTATAGEDVRDHVLTRGQMMKPWELSGMAHLKM